MSEPEPQKAGSPVLGSRFLKEVAAAGEETFTADGAIHKTGILTLILVAGAILTWSQPGFGVALLPLLLVAFVLAMIITFNPASSPFLAPLYALLEGMVLGALSSMYEVLYHGIVFQAAAGTMGILGFMVVGYASGFLKLGARMKAVVIASTMGLALCYLFSIVAGMFGYHVGFIHDSGPWGIGFSVFALIIAALNFSLDFEFIEVSAQQGLSKRMEWYAGFGVLVTLVWVYLEMLRLLGKLRKK